MTASQSYTASFASFTFTITPSVGPNGTSLPAAQTTKNYGTSQTVTFTPTTGYHVVDVLVDGVSVGAVTSYPFTGITANHTISATFAINSYTLTYSANANGSITGATPQTLTHGSNGSSVTAVPNTGYHFTSWAPGGSTNPTRTELNVTSTQSYTASFAINQFTNTYVAGAHGSLTGTTPQTVNYGSNCTIVTAVPASGYHFTSWSDGLTTAARTDVNVTSSHTYTATFALNQWLLTYLAGANGSVSGNTSQPLASNANGTSVTAIANSGYYFVSWSDGVTTASRTDLNVTANATYTANFSLTAQPVTYAAGANGSITGNSSQSVNFGGNGTSVTATPDTGYHFVKWSDNGISATRSETNVTTALSFTATFAINTYNVSAIAGSNGSISTPGTTVANYGDTLSYTITPSTGYQVATVLVDGGSVGPVTSYSFSAISAGHSIQVTFSHTALTLTYSAGAHGSITGATPQSVNYGSSGTLVTAVPDTGYHFTTWSDSGSSAARTESVVTTNLSFTTSFAINTFNILAVPVGYPTSASIYGT